MFSRIDPTGSSTIKSRLWKSASTLSGVHYVGYLIFLIPQLNADSWEILLHSVLLYILLMHFLIILE